MERGGMRKTFPHPQERCDKSLGVSFCFHISVGRDKGLWVLGQNVGARQSVFVINPSKTRIENGLIVGR
jgi:hypothetical protein